MERLRRPGAKGLHLLPGGSVMVDYGSRRIPIPSAQYKANGYQPSLEKLALKSQGLWAGSPAAGQASLNDLGLSAYRASVAKIR